MNIVLLSLIELVGFIVFVLLVKAIYRLIKTKVTYTKIYNLFKKNEIISSMCFDITKEYEFDPGNEGKVFLLSFMLEYHVVHILAFIPDDKNKEILFNKVKSFVARKNKKTYSAFTSAYIVAMLINSSTVYNKCMNMIDDVKSHIEFDPQVVTNWYHKYGWKIEITDSKGNQTI